MDFSTQWDIGANPTTQEIKEAWDMKVIENMAPGINGPSLNNGTFLENDHISVEIADFPTENEKLIIKIAKANI